MLDAPFAKMTRAADQIKEFAADVQAHFHGHPYELAPKLVARQGIEVWHIKPKGELPVAFNLRAGEILHNLRSPLDQTLSAIALQNHPDPTGVGFPFGKTKGNFETILRRQKKLPVAALRMIEGLRPYIFKGDALLAAVHYLNIGDKHSGLTPVAKMELTWTLIVGRGAF